MALAALAAACDGTGPVQVDRFVIRVDEILAPDTLAPNEPLQAFFLGTIGPDLCYRFHRADALRETEFLEIEFFGEHVLRGNCAAGPANLVYEAIILPPFGETFEIRVIQPDGQVLAQVIAVGEELF